MKRIFLALGILVFLGLIVFAGYFFATRDGVLPEAGPPGGRLPLPGEEFGNAPAPALEENRRFGIVARIPAFAYGVRDRIVTIIGPDGRVSQVKNGSVTTASETPIADLRAASFSFDNKKILAIFGNRNEPQVSVFDLDSRSWTPLPLGIQSPAWSPKNYEIAYLETESDRKALAVLDLGNPKAKPRIILRLALEDTDLIWPALDRILLKDKPSASYPGSLWAYDSKKKTLTPLVADKPGLMVQPNASGDRLLVFESAKNFRGGTMSLLDGSGMLLRRFSLGTLPSKCAFDAQASSSLICAVPRNPLKFNRSALPDAYLKKDLFTIDDVYRINLADGGLEALFNEGMFAVDADGLLVSEDALFFMNRFDGFVYGIGFGSQE